jgi:hypothetical protein
MDVHPLLRIYREADAEDCHISGLYKRDDIENAFYVTLRLSEEIAISKLIPIKENPLQNLIQGFDPTSVPPRNVLRSIILIFTVEMEVLVACVLFAADF